MEGLCPCGHEPTGSIVPVSRLLDLQIFFSRLAYINSNLTILLQLKFIPPVTEISVTDDSFTVAILVCIFVVLGSVNISGQAPVLND